MPVNSESPVRPALLADGRKYHADLQKGRGIHRKRMLNDSDDLSFNV